MHVATMRSGVYLTPTRPLLFMYLVLKPSPSFPDCATYRGALSNLVAPLSWAAYSLVSAADYWEVCFNEFGYLYIFSPYAADEGVIHSTNLGAE